MGKAAAAAAANTLTPENNSQFSRHNSSNSYAQVVLGSPVQCADCIWINCDSTIKNKNKRGSEEGVKRESALPNHHHPMTSEGSSSETIFPSVVAILSVYCRRCCCCHCFTARAKLCCCLCSNNTKQQKHNTTQHGNHLRVSEREDGTETKLKSLACLLSQIVCAHSSEPFCS